MKKINYLILALIVLMSCRGFALTLAENGKTNYRIIIPAAATDKEKHAANVLSDYLNQATLAVYYIYPDTVPVAPQEILIGRTSHNIKLQPLMDNNQFVIETREESILIYGGNENGVIYAVYNFLEKYLQARMYSSDFIQIKDFNKLTIPDDIIFKDAPKITFRDYHYTATVNDKYREWHGLMQHFSDTATSNWGMFVHTFDRLIPAAEYFDSHPEYFAFYGGKRQPSQLCLSNDTVFQLLVSNLKLKMSGNSKAKYWSVSQNDNFGYCQCERCHVVDSIEKSPSGSVIRFVNKVAVQFPDKVISTLAYEYTRSAPIVTVPEKNVNIMFCSIECNRSLPIKDDPSSAGFRKDFEDWCKLTHNILVWDYVVQFSNYISPFPNLKVLQPNIQYFYEHGVTDIFEQGSSGDWSSFGEMKAYVISALLWNPYVNVDSVINEFATGFYGEGAKDVLSYYKQLDRNLTASKAGLDIFGNPVSPNKTWLKTADLKAYNTAINKAIAAADPYLRKNVMKESLTLQYVFLEQAKFYGTGEYGIFEKQNGKWIAKESVKKAVADFVAGMKSQHLYHLNENGLTPDAYAKQWEHIFDHGMIEHLAMDKKVSFEIPYSEKYPAKGAATLTDGIGGYDDYHYNWLGWEGTHMTAIVDLGEIQNVNSVSCDFMDDQKSWIFFPSGVEYFFSTDGKDFISVGICKGEEPVPAKVFSTKTFEVKVKENLKARYIKVVATSLKTCPKWHIGALNNCWIFCDEIVVH